MTVVAIIQARTGSSRLPGKVLLPLDGVPVIEHEIRRANAVPTIDDVVIATSRETQDDIIERWVSTSESEVYRGDEADVLGRLADAATAHDADVVVRVSGDNPLLSTELLDALAARVKGGAVEYVSSKFERTFPVGVNADAFTADVLQEAATDAESDHHREHVGQYFKDNRSRFETASVRAVEVFERDLCQRADLTTLRLTLDELTDYRLLYQIYDDVEYEGVLPTPTAIEHLLDNNLAKLNRDVDQRVS